ncbi:MAG TPA: helix-turn-helix domain-containing protein [Anoxybacillus sp.]|nr:helix-turn-helix domain-containing protein [Anoxybacillus sp.]
MDEEKSGRKARTNFNMFTEKSPTSKRSVGRRGSWAAFQAVSDKGYEAVTLQDIADYAGVSKGVTNYYFENKEAVF